MKANVVVGGTFDHLHQGHKRILERAFQTGEKIIIGLTTKKLTKQKFLFQTIESYSKRKKALTDYLFSQNYQGHFEIYPLNHPFGLTIVREDIKAIVVSQETYPVALRINEERLKKGFLPLAIITAPFVLADDGKVISSERIRRGIINREGKSFLKFFLDKKKIFKLPLNLRDNLRSPLGKVFLAEGRSEKETALKVKNFIFSFSPVMTIAVGDIISNSLELVGFSPQIKIIDYRFRRKPITTKKNLKIPGYLNQAGTVSSQVALVINLVIDNFLKTGEKKTIVIDGEEDLTALPSILLAPLSSVVVYGHFQFGAVAVVVDEEKKEEIFEIMKRFV